MVTWWLSIWKCWGDLLVLFFPKMWHFFVNFTRWTVTKIFEFLDFWFSVDLWTFSFTSFQKYFRYTFFVLLLCYIAIVLLCDFWSIEYWRKNSRGVNIYPFIPIWVLRSILNYAPQYRTLFLCSTKFIYYWIYDVINIKIIIGL